MESRSKVGSSRTAPFRWSYPVCCTFLGPQSSGGKEEKKHWYDNISDGQKQALEVKP